MDMELKLSTNCMPTNVTTRIPTILQPRDGCLPCPPVTAEEDGMRGAVDGEVDLDDRVEDAGDVMVDVTCILSYLWGVVCFD